MPRDTRSGEVLCTCRCTRTGEVLCAGRMLTHTWCVVMQAKCYAGAVECASIDPKSAQFGCAPNHHGTIGCGVEETDRKRSMILWTLCKNDLLSH